MIVENMHAYFKDIFKGYLSFIRDITAPKTAMLYGDVKFQHSERHAPN